MTDARVLNVKRPPELEDSEGRLPLPVARGGMRYGAGLAYDAPPHSVNPIEPDRMSGRGSEVKPAASDIWPMIDCFRHHTPTETEPDLRPKRETRPPTGAAGSEPIGRVTPRGCRPRVVIPAHKGFRGPLRRFYALWVPSVDASPMCVPVEPRTASCVMVLWCVYAEPKDGDCQSGRKDPTRPPLRLAPAP